eukprot:TRINITY_DN6785_c0_g1_i1.p1 TRINITY_DN6785_c0_g1~~TRINITY_DN6785_c0_g1_i1.p1  ORF type:complete len:188 (+),score=17.37 TRINITY_DN6785_c0_g1_i1:517-1080(+)
MIIYLSESDECGGGTAVAPRLGPEDKAYDYPIIAMPGYAGLPFINNRTIAEKYMQENHPEFFDLRKSLYEREMISKYSTGTVLLYRHDVWHRGTPTIPGSVRVVVNLGYCKKECSWVTIWNQGWARKMYDSFVEEIVGKATLLQRSVLGFPPPGHKYWNDKTIMCAVARFGCFGFDPTPYKEALCKH